MEDAPPSPQPNGAKSFSQVRITLSSQHEEFQLPQDVRTVLVSTNLRRIQLSTLVNSLLEPEKPIPFEFLINGHFLRTSIDQFLSTHGISAETALSVEFVRALVPPSKSASFPHDDWVSTVDVCSSTSRFPLSSGDGYILSGSYDGILRIWDQNSQVLALSEPQGQGPNVPIKTAKFMGPTCIVSGSLDRAIRVWKYTASSDISVKGELKSKLELYGHTSNIESIDLHPSNSRILSASADHTIGFWSSQKATAPEVNPGLLPIEISAKRRKTSLSSKSKVTNVTKRGPLALLHAHTGPVMGAIFAPNSSTVAYSISMDKTLRTWDLLVASDSPKTSNVSTRMVTSSLLSICNLPSLNLVAAGTADRTIVLMDPRESATHTVAKTLKGHTNWVSALTASPISEYGLASASYDGTVRIWDVRGGGNSQSDDSNPASGSDSMFVIRRESAEEGKKAAGQGPKVFDLVWDQQIGIVSGGEDNKVQIDHGSA